MRLLNAGTAKAPTIAVILARVLIGLQDTDKNAATNKRLCIKGVSVCVMKRGGGESGDADATPSNVPKLQDLILIHIVSSFGSEDAMAFYLGAISNPHIRELIKTWWAAKNATPMRSLVCTKRRLISAEISVSYLDTRELVGNGGTLSQTMRRHTIPIIADAEIGTLLNDAVLSKLQMNAHRSTNHRGVRFVLY